MSATLFVYTGQNLSLADALSAFTRVIGQNGATAILYTPQSCELATFDEATLRAFDGQPVDIGGVFEARVFCETAELRWLDAPSAHTSPRTAILTEQKCLANLEGWNCAEREDIIGQLPQTYLLWGEGTGQMVSNNGWSELATAQIGSLRVPIPNVGNGQRVLLHSVEYIVEAEHGNAMVFDERLMKLEVAHG